MVPSEEVDSDKYFTSIRSAGVARSVQDKLAEHSLQEDVQFLKKQLKNSADFGKKRSRLAPSTVMAQASESRSLATALSLVTQVYTISNAVSDDFGKAVLGRVLLASQQLNTNDAARDLAQIYERALGRNMAPKYLTLWEWFTSFGPDLVSTMWAVYQRNSGKLTLTEAYPSFSKLFLDLLNSMTHWYNTKPARSTREHAPADKRPEMLPCILTSEHFSAWKMVVTGSYPLLRVELDKTIPKPLSDAFTKDHSDLFLEVLYRVLLHPQLTSIYNKSKSHFSKSELGTTRDKYSFKPSIAFTAFKDVLVSRGGLCHILLQSFQTDSIFAVKGFETFIESPWSFFQYEAESGNGRARMSAECCRISRRWRTL